MVSNIQSIDSKFYKENFNTPLNQEESAAFDAWIKRLSSYYGRDVSGDNADYDIQGAYKAYGNSLGAHDDGYASFMGHGTDEFKKPNHPTFSNESIYHGTEGPNGQLYEGGAWVGDQGFVPSQWNLGITPMPALQQYFAKVEPGLNIIPPLPPDPKSLKSDEDY